MILASYEIYFNPVIRCCNDIWCWVSINVIRKRKKEEIKNVNGKKKKKDEDKVILYIFS